MKPTYRDMDILLLDKISPRFNDYERFEVVVFKHKNSILIKRIIGIPGDTVEVKEGDLYINDEKKEEKYLKGTMTKDFKFSDITTNDKIPEDMYLVLGDNRNNSLDSRIFGLIDKDQIIGRISFRLINFKKK